MSLAVAFVCSQFVAVLVLWAAVASGRSQSIADDGPPLRCNEGDCSQPMGLEATFYRYPAPGRKPKRIKEWRCRAGHAWTSTESGWCERFDRDEYRDRPDLVVISTLLGQATMEKLAGARA